MIGKCEKSKYSRILQSTPSLHSSIHLDTYSCLNVLQRNRSKYYTMHVMANALVFASAVTLLIGTSGYFNPSRASVVHPRTTYSKISGNPSFNYGITVSNYTEKNASIGTTQFASINGSGKEHIIRNWSKQWECVRINPKRVNSTLNRERLAAILLQSLRRTIRALAEEYVRRMKCFPK